MSDLEQAIERGLAGGPQRHHEKSEQQGKLPVRERVARLLTKARSPRTACSRTGRRMAWAPTASSPAPGRSTAGRSR